MTKQWGIVLVAAAFLWGNVRNNPAQAAGDIFERISLKGLKTVQVVVEDLAPDIAQGGLNREQIKFSVERQLQRAGLAVEQQAENAFYIHLGSAKNEAGSYSYALSLQLLQLVMLIRDPSLVTWGATWSLDLVGSVAPANIGEIKPLIARGVDAFVTDYYAANQLSG